ncbi:MED27 [Scenedesmus sp. PABB004]|nr:MED27 [Scenedesmus sp. PABB004]
MEDATDPAALVGQAIATVYHLKADVEAGLCAGPDGAALECLERAQLSIGALQALAPALQALADRAAAAGQAACGEQQALPPGAAWVAEAQQRAARAVEALQQEVAAALAAPRGGGLRRLVPRQPHGADTNHLPLARLMHRVFGAAPGLQLHLFRSSTNQLLASYEMVPDGKGGQRAREPQPDTLARSASWVDEVRVVAPGVFAASVALSAPGRLDPVRVSVDSHDKAASVDAWTTSKHQARRRAARRRAAPSAGAGLPTARRALTAAARRGLQVFKRITYLAVRAVRHFQTLQAAHMLLEGPQQPEGGGDGDGGEDRDRPAAAGVALECLLLWLACYDDLFSRPCAVSGKLIAWEPATAVPLPPLLRPYWLSMEQLRVAAADRGKREAYHTHLAPWPASEASAAAGVAAAGGAADAAGGALLGLDGGCGVAAPVSVEQLLAQLRDVVAQ